MAGRIRTLKPEWLEDEKLMTLSVEARLLSVAVLLLADDHGRARGHPAHLAASVFPLDEEGVATAKRALAELVSAGYVRTYLVRGQTYYEVVNWRKHQRVDRPGAPRVPCPEEADATGNVEKAPLARDSREPPERLATDSRDSRERLATDLRSPITISDHDHDHDARDPEPAPVADRVPLRDLLRHETEIVHGTPFAPNAPRPVADAVAIASKHGVDRGTVAACLTRWRGPRSRFDVAMAFVCAHGPSSFGAGYVVSAFRDLDPELVDGWDRDGRPAASRAPPDQPATHRLANFDLALEET